MKKILFSLLALFNLSITFGQTYITSTIAGSSNAGYVDANGTNAQFLGAQGIDLDNNGNIFVVESANPRIRKIDGNGNVSTYAGSGNEGHINGAALSSRFYGPVGMVKDNNGTVYICDRFNNAIRKIDANLVVSTFSGSTAFGGTGAFSDGPNGSGIGYNRPVGICLDLQGNLIIADSQNYKIRKIDLTTNTVTTIAGSTQGLQDGNSTNAKFDFPYDVAVDSQNNIYVTEYQLGKIRKIDSNGGVTTLNVSFNGLSGIAIDQTDNIYVTVPQSHLVNKILPNGTVIRIGGQIGAPFNGGYVDGDVSVSQFSYPQGIDVDAQGNIYVAENSKIRKITYTPQAYSCEAASVLAANSGYVNIGAIGGTVPSVNCLIDNHPGLKANWWKFTPSQNGQLLVTSNISQNNVNTRLGIYAGTCGSMSCLASNDDISAQNLYSQVSQVNLTAGTTYYIVWDNFHSNDSNGVFYYEFTPISGNAQSCATAKALAPYSGTVIMGTITGSIPSNGICYTYSQSNPNANWWSFTPTQNGLLDITTVTPQNAATVDTRLSIFTGNCGALSCFTGSDNISGADLRSNLKDVILTAGTTYYFVFDDKVSDNAAVNFYYEFTPQTCFRPNSIDAVAGSNTEVTYAVDWDSPTLGDTTPDSYTVQIGPEGYTVDSPAAIQTYPNLTGNSATLTGLTPNTVYDFYIKSVCSPTDASVWYGPFKIMTEFTAVSPTYSENFDSAASFLFVGWSRSGGSSNSLWRTYTSGPNTFTQSGQYSVYSPIEPAINTPANAFAYTRKMNLLAGQNYKVSYYPRTFIGAGVTLNGNMEVLLTPNTDYTNTATHVQIASRNVVGQTTFSTMYEDAFTVPSNGVYRIGFKNGVTRTAGTATSYLMLDTVVISTMLSVDDFNTSGLSMFPNPVLDHVSIANNNNMQISTYAVVDLNGRTLVTKKYDANSNLIDLTNLKKGIYFIQLETEKGILSKKISKD